MSGLTNKQKAFIDEYMIDLNATQAAKRAGYSKKTCGQIGTQLLVKLSIELQAAMDARTVRTLVTADRVLAELAKLAYSNTEDYITIGKDGLASIDLSELTRDQAAAITEISVETRREFNSKDDNAATIEKVKLKLADKGINLERLGKHLKLFTDKVEHSGELIVNMPAKAAGML